jgi:cortactin
MSVVVDYAVGFGGKFGVQADRQDKSAVGWDHHERLQQHESQTDHSKVKMFANFRILKFYL